MTDMLEPIVGGALGLWFALTALAQVLPSTPMRRLLRWDLLTLVVPYSFYAPDPRLEDTRVESRRLVVDGPPSEWQPAWNYRSRTLLGALWNPHRLADTCFAKDCWQVVAACRRGVPPEELERLAAFQHVLNVVRYRTMGPGGSGLFEFRVVAVQFGSESEDIVLHSGPRGA